MLSNFPLLSLLWTMLSLMSALRNTGRNRINLCRKNVLRMSSTKGLLAVHVKGKLVDGSSSEFYDATIANAKNSILETGVGRFDVLRGLEGRDDFLLIEVYKTETGPDEHKKTEHYNTWRESVAPLMAIPRSATKYITIFPPPVHWKTDSSASDVNPTEYKQSIPWDSQPFVHSSDSQSAGSMLTVIVDVEVIDGAEESFIAATIKNCENSIKEAGIHRFDLLRGLDNPNKFSLVEVYNNAEGPIEHKKTKHYAEWAATVAPWMKSARKASKFASLFPKPLYWHRSSFLSHRAEGGDGDGGARGLSAVSGGAFGFLGPKIAMGRNIAEKALLSAMKELEIVKPFVVTGKGGLARYSSILSSALGSAGAVVGNLDDLRARYAVSGEPTVEDALEATRIALEQGCDSVIAIGGGSAIDLGKAVSALVTNRGDVYDYLEVIGKGQAITSRPLPYIAIPTTSGTGAEVTKNAVLKSLQHGRKVSMRHDWMVPSVAIVDPSLTISCPPTTTAHVGLDTLCQVVEPYTSNAANPFTDALAKEGILRASRSLRAVVTNGNDIEAREDLAVASVLGGLCLANAKLGTVHGYAGVIGGMFETAPHGAICAALLPFVMRKNAEKLEKLKDEGDAVAAIRLRRLQDVAAILTGDPSASVMEGVAWVEALSRDLEIPSISKLCGLQLQQLDEVAEATAAASSTKGNPVAWTNQELVDVLRAAY